MASPSLTLDIEAQTDSGTETRPANTPLSPPSANPELSATSPAQDTNTNQHHYENSARKTTDNSGVQRDENYGDSSDGLWSMYLTEAEKQDKEVTESWKGDTDGILVFTGLFSATVAAFIIESYQNLSPDSAETTNALLIHISQQIFNSSTGQPLTSIAAQIGQSFEPKPSAVRVNVLWFLSLVLSLSCALSATLMQQWARRYRELAQRRGAFHRRGRMRAYISYGINRFGMARAVATMPTLLHISVFLFFAGLVEFLFPIHATVAYTTLGCIILFALAYANLTILPNIYHSCPYDTPLSGLMWRISHLAVVGFLWITLKIEGALRKPLSKLWSLVNQPAPEPDGLNSLRRTLKNQVKIRRQWLSQGMRKSAEFSAYEAESAVVTSALEWTLTALDEDREIEDFSLRIPGFFDSSVVPDATSAILPLMSHQPNSDPIFGSRLYDLLKTCIPETSSLDEEMRKNRLRACIKCLWSFAKAYNQVGSSQALPSYFPHALASPEVTRLFQAEEDSGIRVIGRCYGALIVNKLVADLGDPRADPISDKELACLSAILGDNSHDVKLCLRQRGAVKLANMISLTLDDVDSLATDTVLSYVWDVVQHTLDILSQAVSSQEAAIVQLDRPISMINGSGPSGGNFGCILEFRLLDLLDTCLKVTSIEERVRTSCLRMCLKSLWNFGRTFNQLGNSMPLSSFNCFALTDPEMIHRIHGQHDLTVRVIGRCVQALVVNKLAADIKSRTITVSNDELACLSAILGIESDDAMLLLSYPGAIEFTNMIFLALDNFDSATGIFPDVPDVVQETLGILSRALPADLNVAIPLGQTDTRMNIYDGAPSLTAAMYTSVLHVWMRILWPFARNYNETWNLAHLPSYVCISFINPEMTRRIREERDPAVRVIGRCVEALVVNKLTVDMKSSDRQVTDGKLKLACLSALLGSKSDDVMLLLDHPGAVGFTIMVFLALDNSQSFTEDIVPSAILNVVQEAFSIVSQALPADWNNARSLDLTDSLVNASDAVSPATDTAYISVLRLWMKNLWSFARDCNERQDERGNPVPLPSSVCIAFTNPEMTRRIHEERDLAVRVIGRCVEALVVNKLVADIKSRDVPASNHELVCLSAILGTNRNNVEVLLDCPGAIEFTNMAFLALDDLYSSTLETMPLYVLEVVQATFRSLSQALPFEPNPEMVSIQTDSLAGVSNSTSSLTAAKYRSVLRVWMTNLWYFARECNKPGSSALPPYVRIAFTNPEMTRRLREECDLAVRVMGRCIQALVVTKLTTDIKSRDGPVSSSDERLVCLSAILGTDSHEVRLCLGQPDTIELVILTSLALGDVSSLRADQLPPDARSVLQQTFTVLSQTLPYPTHAGLLQDRTTSLANIPDDKYERTIVSRLDSLLKMCVSDASSFIAEEVRTSHLRMVLKTLWHCSKAYHQIPKPLPSYFPLVLARPEIISHLQSAPDISVRITGCCFGALIASKLVDTLEPPISLGGPIRNADVACISAILGTLNSDGLLSPHQLHLINFWNVVSLMSSKIDRLFTSEGMPADLLIMAQDTLYVIANSLRDSMFVLGSLPRDQGRLLQEIYLEVENALSSDQLKDETLKTLDRLRQILGKLLPAVGSKVGTSQGAARQNLDTRSRIC